MHNFILLDKNKFSYDICCDFFDKVSYDVSIHDDLIQYFNDFIKWIPSYNPSKKVRHLGLNYYGLTIIDSEGAKEAKILFSSLVDILNLGPNCLKLTGAYGFVYALDGITDPNEKVDRILKESIGYEKIILQKKEVIKQFELLSELMQKVIKSDKNYYVLHFGI